MHFATRRTAGACDMQSLDPSSPAQRRMQLVPANLIGVHGRAAGVNRLTRKPSRRWPRGQIASTNVVHLGQEIDMPTKLTLTLATVLVTAGIASVAQAKATVEKEKFKGSQAFTLFQVNETLTCADGSSGSVFASGSFSGSDSMTNETGTPKTTSNGIFLEIDIYSNTCTGVNFSFATGGISGGYTPPTKSLSSAELAGTGSVQDFDTGATFPVSLDLVFEGTGPLTSSKSHSKTRTVQTPDGPITIEEDTSANSNRAADVSGTLSINGQDLDATFSTTTLISNANRDLTITKN
jgi:hypothetical protein